MDREVLGIGALSRLLGLSVSRVRQLADAEVIPSVRTAGGHRRFDRALAVASYRAHRLAEVVPDRARVPRSRQRLDLADLAEDLVWRDVRLTLGELESLPRARVIAGYAFTEILNNAIDHSSGYHVDVQVGIDGGVLWIEIADDGVGTLAHLRDSFELPDLFASIAELTKGKRTTMSEAHTGEGIFFTSKAVDTFELASNGLRWFVDNLRDDIGVGISEVVTGTTVRIAIALATERHLAEVFAEFTTNHEFARSRPVIELFEIGSEFVSRSEAKRLAVGLEEFDQVELDFDRVDMVGQGFVDELFRVWANEHPSTELIPVRMNPAVAFMVERGLPRR